MSETPPLDPHRLAEAVALADDLSLRELDRLSGCAQTIASKVVSGQSTRIELATAKGWAQTLGVSLDWLTGRTDTRPESSGVRAAVIEARRRYAAAHPPRGRKGAGARVLSMLAKRSGPKQGSVEDKERH